MIVFVVFACAGREVHTIQRYSGMQVGGADGPFAPADPPELLRTGQWIRVGEVTAYSYVDPSEGLSVQWRDGDSVFVRRLEWAPSGAVSADDSPPPEWLAAYGPQPPNGTPYGRWRTDPGFAGRLHPDYPDDLRVVVGTEAFFEVVWVRILECRALACDAALLNQPDRVPLTLAERLSFDLTGVGPALPPVAARAGEPPDAGLVRQVASNQGFGGQLQDDAAWTPDFTLPAEQRLIPLGVWGRVGADFAYTTLGPYGPVAAVAGRRSTQSLQWLPAGWVPLSDAEREAAGLPAELEVEGALPHERGAIWGEWRVDPFTKRLFTEATPDSLTVRLPDGAVATVWITSCRLPVSCRGRLGEDTGAARSGDVFEFGTFVPDDGDPNLIFLPDAVAVPR